MNRDLAAAVDERLAERRARAVERAANLRELRALRKAARAAGLVQRHAAKLARTPPQGDDRG